MADTSTVPAWVAVASALAGGGIVGAFNFITNLINKRSEERRHFQELMFNAAIENWKQSCTFALNSGGPANVAPLDSYIVHMIKLAEVLTSTPLNKDNIRGKLKEISDVAYEAEQFAREFTDKKNSAAKKS